MPKPYHFSPCPNKVANIETKRELGSMEMFKTKDFFLNCYDHLSTAKIPQFKVTSCFNEEEYSNILIKLTSKKEIKAI